ncbi:hypothetical protein M8868_11490 [Pasteurella multocida]|uniref:Uncharacterized protein n=1 Tax=Pasteurella multocida TaxID=747 RepID=A0A849CM79_PASMD|nr:MULTISPECIES: hypothetical protein [Gammaproteobacteria]AFF24628.1 hypothetical protein PMCN06_1398 [Pasteurella multocida subsp. multocida str. HN06]AXN95856.1 hypothetical protein DYY62_08355 [Pasteurella multocida]AXN99659.1 hypothetical protein DYY61_07825 [Pasteurella multocida]AXO01869.1 hypothetical protein DYY63_07825 [Pasteurella multocida]AXO04089.1 hypothetical protein DYY64_07830 [Pasteurella multocida]
MKIEFNFSLKIDDQETLTRKVKFDSNNKRAEILAVQIIKQLENSKLDAEFDHIYDYRKGSAT